MDGQTPRVALVVSILKGRDLGGGSGPEVAEDDWREKFLLGAENALRSAPSRTKTVKDEQIKKLKQKIGTSCSTTTFTGGLEAVPFGPEDIRRVRASVTGVSGTTELSGARRQPSGLHRPAAQQEREAGGHPPWIERLRH